MNDSTTKTPGEDSMKQRLLKLLKAKRITQTEFTRHLGVTPNYIGAMRKGMPKERLKVVFDMFPDLNRDWLLYGEGEMFLPDDSDSPDLSKGYVVPMLPVEAYAGNLQLWSRGVQLRDCEKVVSPVPGVDFGIRVTGNSMEPEFHDGSVLFIKRINEKAFIPWGNPMVIDTENGVVVKIVYPPHNREIHPGCKMEYIEARSYNPAYPPFNIPTESIYGLYRIITSIRQYSTI
ncbi:MAG: hypothetical protein K2K97_01035 [Muribaculaceae bacterium]|nr:hypothetical protein [Muribaculaceae bacterium]